MDIVVKAWDSITSQLIRRGFINAGLLPIGPQGGSFSISEPAVPEDEQSDTEDET